MKRRNRRYSLILAAFAAVLAAAVVSWDRFEGNDAVTLAVGDVGDELRITWGGDTMVGDAADPLIAEHGAEWLFEGIASLLDGDVVIVNAEAPITSRNDPYAPYKLYSYATDPSVAGVLKAAGVTALSLSNNHILDQGPAGLEDTIRHADDAGLSTFGAGMDHRAAERPLLIESDLGTVAVVAIAKGYGGRFTAANGRAGVIPFSTSSINRGYTLAKAAGADWVIAFAHWGANYAAEPDTQQLLEARKFAKAGYDMVIGAGPHVQQGAEVIDGMPVFYSLGNLVFGSRGRFTDRAPGYGLVVDTVLTETGLSRLEVTCIVVDNQRINYQPQVCSGQEAAIVLGELGLPLDLTGSTGSMQLPAVPLANHTSASPSGE